MWRDISADYKFFKKKDITTGYLTEFVSIFILCNAFNT